MKALPVIFGVSLLICFLQSLSEADASTVATTLTISPNATNGTGTGGSPTGPGGSGGSGTGTGGLGNGTGGSGSPVHTNRTQGGDSGSPCTSFSSVTVLIIAGVFAIADIA